MNTPMKFSAFLAEQEIEPSVNAPVLVKGIGMMTAEQIRQKAVSMLQDMAGRAASEQVDWKSVKWMLGHSALHAYIDTLVSLQEKENA